MIYLDHNATTPLHPRVFEAMEPFLKERWGNASSPHRLGRDARMAVEEARVKIAECVGAEPEEIVFTAGGTESDNLAIRGVLQAVAKARKGWVVTSAVEHHAVLHTCQALEQAGHRIDYLPVNEDGQVELDAAARVLTSQTDLLSVMFANNETGVVNPVVELAELARERGVLIHTDAVQALGKVPLNLKKLGVDLASFAAHKVYGPKGVGFLYVRRGTPLAPVLTGGHQERGLRPGTENVAGIVGMAEAVALVCEAVEKEKARLSELRDRLERSICQRLGAVKVNGQAAPRVANTSSLSFDAVEGESLVLALDLEGICVSSGSACTTGAPEPSHVLKAMGVPPRLAQGTIRISLGLNTTAEEIDRTVETLEKVVQKLRAISSV